MSLEETIIGAAVSAGIKKLTDDPPPKHGKNRAQQLRDHIDILEAERLVLTIELRSALMREAKKLLPAAIRQAKGHKAPETANSTPAPPCCASSPASRCATPASTAAPANSTKSRPHLRAHKKRGPPHPRPGGRKTPTNRAIPGPRQAKTAAKTISTARW